MLVSSPPPPSSSSRTLTTYLFSFLPLNFSHSIPCWQKKIPFCRNAEKHYVTSWIKRTFPIWGQRWEALCDQLVERTYPVWSGSAEKHFVEHFQSQSESISFCLQSEFDWRLIDASVATSFVPMCWEKFRNVLATMLTRNEVVGCIEINYNVHFSWLRMKSVRKNSTWNLSKSILYATPQKVSQEQVSSWKEGQENEFRHQMAFYRSCSATFSQFSTSKWL